MKKSKFSRYLPNNDNITDGGFHDDRSVRMSLNDDSMINLTPEQEKEFRDKYSIQNNFDLKEISATAYARGIKIQYDDTSDLCYFIVEIGSGRSNNKSVIHLIIESEILKNRFDEIFEIPHKNMTTIGAIRIVIPLKKDLSKKTYKVHMEYKDSKEFIYHIKDEEYYVEKDKYVERDSYDKLYNIYDTKKYEIEYRDTMSIEYGYKDSTHGGVFTKIEGIEAYQKEDSTWTSEAVENPEKYLKSDLDWYYSDERVIQYLVNKKVFTEEQANAIRAANYEDIFSIEYKIKHYGFIFLIIFFALIVAIVVRKIIKKRQKDV